MRICHFSDWHASSRNLPPADVYVCTGDMLPNAPYLVFERENGIREIWDPYEVPPMAQPGGTLIRREIYVHKEEKFQTHWIEREVELGGYRRLFPEESRNAHVICVRGNHDFVPLAPLFGGNVHELGEPPCDFVLTLFGIRWGSIRGINYIEGEWSDELEEPEWDARVRGLPNDIDVLLSHAPPQGILDGAWGRRFGSRALRSYLTVRDLTVDRPLRAHLFGHIHEDNGKMIAPNGTMFVNSATTFNLIDI